MTIGKTIALTIQSLSASDVLCINTLWGKGTNLEVIVPNREDSGDRQDFLFLSKPTFQVLWGCGGWQEGTGVPSHGISPQGAGGLGGTSHEILSQDIQSCPLPETDGRILFFEKDQRPWRAQALGQGWMEVAVSLLRSCPRSQGWDRGERTVTLNVALRAK